MSTRAVSIDIEVTRKGCKRSRYARSGFLVGDLVTVIGSEATDSFPPQNLDRIEEEVNASRCQLSGH